MRNPTNGQYSKKSRIFPTLIIFTIIVLSVLAIRQKMIAPVATEETAPVIVDRTDAELKAIMDEDSFKQAMEFRAKKIKIERRKTEELKRHESEMKGIETEFELLRKQELANPSL